MTSTVSIVSFSTLWSQFLPKKWYWNSCFYLFFFKQPTVQSQLTCQPQVGSSVCNMNLLHIYFTPMTLVLCCPPLVKPCGGSLFGSGTFSSPNHPNYYHDNAYCVWQLRAPYDQRIFLAFTYLQWVNNNHIFGDHYYTLAALGYYMNYKWRNYVKTEITYRSQEYY